MKVILQSQTYLFKPKKEKLFLEVIIKRNILNYLMKKI